MEKVFKMIDEEFVCLNCGENVKPLGYTARDHCPNCLYSIHVDNNPGDRMSLCKGFLVPIRVEDLNLDDMKIVYECDKCHMVKRNKKASDDNFEEILRIMKESS